MLHRNKTLSIVMPAFNEEGCIAHAVDQAALYLSSRKIAGEIIISDDGSTDGTLKILSDLKKKHPNLVVVKHKRNEGYGAAVYDGLCAAKSDLIFFTDSDQQFDVEELDIFLEKIDEYDVAIGYRKNRSEGWRRKMNAKGWALVCYVTLGLKHRDIDCAFKLMRKSALEGIKINSKGAAFSAELLHKLKRSGASIIELPVSHYRRKSGHPTGAKLSVIIRGFKEIFVLRRSTKK